MRTLGGQTCPSVERETSQVSDVFLLCVMCSSTHGRASVPRIAGPHMLPSTLLTGSASAVLWLSRLNGTTTTQSLCTLRTRRRRRPRNTRYRAPATAYPDRSLTGRTTPAFLAHKQSIDPQRKCGLLRRFAPRNDERQSGNHAAVRPRLDAGFSATPSCCSSHRLRSSPPPYPVSDPLAPITR